LRKLQSAARWHEAETLPDANDLPGLPARSTGGNQRGPREGSDTHPLPCAASPPATRALIWRTRHRSVCGVARFDGERLDVWTHAQGVYPLQKDLALML
jgi:hypothetical protein